MEFAIEALDELGRAGILAIGLVAIPIDDIADGVDPDAIEMEIGEEVVHRRHEEATDRVFAEVELALPQGRNGVAGIAYS
jgi:hypothetical protein